ncbi:MAG: NADH:ubiquinone reductase (Na(+)-transporting) subunit B [Alphaproteobacteria bacterium]|nr:NADH:ubiquinone reductase (Na(+)-transporting) subunit B [Alphaproteobacteria bacterium]
MRWLRDLLDKQAPMFEKGGKLEKLHPVWEAQDTILFTPGFVTKAGAHIRDALDQKRMMITVVVALGPAMLMAMYNTGYQAHKAIAAGASPVGDWHDAIYTALGMGYDPQNILACFLYGALFFLPVYAVTMAVGGIIEVVFAVIRHDPVTEGFLVTGALFPLILPPLIPLWQVALGIAFAVILGKEVFGGVGYNIFNPALTGRAFLFFAYPAQISGDKVWIAAKGLSADGVSGATALAHASEGGLGQLTSHGFDWMHAFLGLVPGSMGETSALAALLGAGILLLTRVASWQTMVGVTLGTVLMASTLNGIGSETNAFFDVPFWWHMVLGGWAFGMVFMATDPVSSAYTAKGKLLYGLGIGILVVLIRVVNPAYPEGMMLAILFMNMFAPLADHFVLQGNIRRRAKRRVA